MAPFQYTLDGGMCKAGKGSICLLKLNVVGTLQELPAVYLSTGCLSGITCESVKSDKDFDFAGQLDLSVCGGGGRNPFSNTANCIFHSLYLSVCVIQAAVKLKLLLTS